MLTQHAVVNCGPWYHQCARCFSKILRRFRAERSCPHHKIKKKTRAARRFASGIFGFSDPPCLWGERWKNAEFPSKIPADLSTDWVSRSGSRGISSQKHRVETWGNCRRPPRSQKRRPGMCSSFQKEMIFCWTDLYMFDVFECFWCVL